MRRAPLPRPAVSTVFIATVFIATAFVATALTLPTRAFAQQAPGGTTGADDNDQAMRNIQSNFARMTPPPRTIETINQELKQNATSAHAAGGGQRGSGGGRRERMSQNRQDTNGNDNPPAGTTPPPGNAAADTRSSLSTSDN